jgi:ribose transport system substrate-binding protein
VVSPRSPPKAFAIHNFYLKSYAAKRFRDKVPSGEKSSTLGGNVKKFFILMAACLLLTAQAQKTIAVMTPYLASATTKIMVDSLQNALKDKGYTVTVVDTAGDVAALDSRMQDVITQKVDAIVISVNPELIPAGLEAATTASIPVFGMDAGSTQGLVLDVTSNNYVMAAQTATYIVDRIGGKGRVLMLWHPPYAPVQKRGAVAEGIFKNTPDIEIIDQILVEVPGPLENARQRVTDILTANPEAGSISAIWAAWDEPALGALQAIEAAGREGEGIVIVGLDAIDPAREAIAAGGNFEASVAQDFEGIANTVADNVDAFLNGTTPVAKTIYVPATLVTKENASQ